MKGVFFILLLAISASSSAQRYKRIHRKAIVVDTHNDILEDGIMKGLPVEEDLSQRTHTDFNRFKKSGLDVQVFAVFCDETFGKDTAYKYANIEIDSLQAIAARNADKLVMVKNPEEMMRAVKQGKLAGMIGVEGGHMIEDSIAYLDRLFERGARYLTLTWNNSTSWATSAADETKDTLTRKKGLNAFGEGVVREMNKLGMMVDVSHVGEQTLTDVLRISTKPIIASHSGAHVINPVPRNLKDEQIRGIAKNGGVIQVCFVDLFLDSNFARRLQPFELAHKSEIDSLEKLKFSGVATALFLRRKYPEEMKKIIPPISALLDHIDYIVKLAGIDHVGLGGDFDGTSYTPYEMMDITSYPQITSGLLKRGYKKKEITKILGGNFIRVFRENLK